MNLDITPQEDKIKSLKHLLTTEITQPESPDEDLLGQFIDEAIEEYLIDFKTIKDFTDAKIHCLFLIIKKMRIYDGSWDEKYEI